MSLATFISNAVTKVSTDETYANMEFATREEARANFVAALLFELGLGPQPVAVHAPAQEPKESGSEPTQASKEKKAPKKRAAKKAESPKVEALTEQMGQLALTEAKMEDELKKDEPPAKKARKSKAKVEEPAKVEVEVEEVKVEAVATKKKPGPKPKAKPEAVPHVGIGAGVPAPEVAAPKKKPGPKPKTKPEGPVNIEKLTPTHKKHIRAMAEELQCGIDDKGFLDYANAMSAEAWGAKSLDDHLREFVGPLPGAALAPPPTEFEVVEFNEKEYLVDPATKFVYEMVEDGAPVRTRLGTVGLLEFKDMEM